jgi:hypothetical protein
MPDENNRPSQQSQGEEELEREIAHRLAYRKWLEAGAKGAAPHGGTALPTGWVPPTQAETAGAAPSGLRVPSRPNPLTDLAPTPVHARWRQRAAGASARLAERQSQAKPEERTAKATEEARGNPASPEQTAKEAPTSPVPPAQQPTAEASSTPAPSEPQPAKPKEKKIRVDWNRHVKPAFFARCADLGLPNSDDADPDWRLQADAERWVGNFCVPTGEGKPEAQIKKLRGETAIRDHVSLWIKDYATMTKRGLVYDKQKGWTPRKAGK